MKKTALFCVFSVLLAFCPAFAADQIMVLKYTLNVTTGGFGSVMSNPPGIDCTDQTGSCSFSFNAGTEVALLATPRPNDENGTYNFFEWSGDASGTLPAAAVTMDGPKNVTAQFVGLGIPPIL